MPRIKLEPLGISINVSANSGLWRSLKHAKVELAATCGGQGTCGTCALRVFEGGSSLSPMQTLEQITLKNTRKDLSLYRLTCQTSVVDEGVVFYLDNKADKKLVQIFSRLKNKLAPRNIYHPLSGELLIQEGNLITQEILENLLSDA
ncbi:2Fe-2S iron-sulfur cluster binding domain-containing protein [Pseudanabaena sp. FACHB-1998]|uniref:2Fe-2S iron-sulfur cluster-binding protein n=1 Tax=Pseudanabaena sp. FACHB-1998 TaxID=2692858 RepID=UPI001681030F|nr:2Fe-2S iron-sulfur cluster-binding protein [Pseudanabaena sp. FACHB-1998]MBD2178538.1 2Fe-2S iron-sulfur cluster binding domain-containing protein [Pseudanabaena sp. FACHB-1998]